MLDVQRSAPTAPARYASASTPRLFYLAMSLLMLALVTYGFSRTVGPALLNAHRPRHLFSCSASTVWFFTAGCC